MSQDSFAAPPTASAGDRDLEELELQRTIGLTSMHSTETRENTKGTELDSQPVVDRSPRTNFEVRSSPCQMVSMADREWSKDTSRLPNL
jgi:hypothetical protein